jgi:predicted DNA-binding protein (MmcQ/YjbR family)
LNIEYYRDYCLKKPGVTEEFPFDSQTLVFKVMGKVFALTDVDAFSSINLKCDPENAVQLREQFNEVIPGFHMNKKHWNTISMEGNLSDSLVMGWIDDSYALVVSGLPLKKREDLRKSNQ